MREKNTLTIADVSAKTKKYLIDLKNLLTKLDIDTSDLTNYFNTDDTIKIAFVGQYSAGKSTILKALTGIVDIETGVKITTQKTHTYNWEGIEVIDTPGIHTKLRPDHDEITYKAISDSDMIVYVVTHELFDQNIGDNFRKILIEKNKANDMILVVNKMADIGNTKEIQQIKIDDIKKVTDPYDPNELNICFVDAESYIESFEEDDDEIITELITRSNYDMLIKTLNEFIHRRAFKSKLKTPLNQVNDFLQNIIKDFEDTTGDIDIDRSEEGLLQKRKIISSNRHQVEQEIKAIYKEEASKVRELGLEMANEYNYCENEEDFNEKLNNAISLADKISETCRNEIISALERQSQNYEKALDDFYNSDLNKKIQSNIEVKFNEGNPKVVQLLKSKAFKDGSTQLANNLNTLNKAGIHRTVKDVGHIFGYKFKPWEAVKIAKKVKVGGSVAGKAIGVAGIGASVYLQWHEDMEEKKREKEMKKNREELRSLFNELAREIEKNFETLLSNYIKDEFQNSIETLDNQIDEIRTMHITSSKACNQLRDAQKECQALITYIENNI